MSNFSVAFRDCAGTAILDLHGELDAHTAPDLESAILTSREKGGHNVIINGANLDYISSAGLGVFMAFIEEFRAEDGDIKFAALQPKVYNVFDLLGFPLIFHITDSEEEALELFESGVRPL